MLPVNWLRLDLNIEVSQFSLTHYHLVLQIILPQPNCSNESNLQKKTFEANKVLNINTSVPADAKNVAKLHQSKWRMFTWVVLIYVNPTKSFKKSRQFKPSSSSWGTTSRGYLVWFTIIATYSRPTLANRLFISLSYNCSMKSIIQLFYLQRLGIDGLQLRVGLSLQRHMARK